MPSAASAAASPPIERFLLALPMVDVLAEAIAPLCGVDPNQQPGKLRDVEAVSQALMSSRVVEALAGRISHAACVAAAKLAADQPFNTTRIESAGTKKLVEEAMKRQAKVSGGPRVLAAGLATPTSAAANSADAFVGAQLLYGEGGIEPAMWGVSKAQFSLFLDQVRAAHALGHIANVPPSEGSGYPQERFDDPEVGPSIHQVCARVVKPATRACSPLPGVAWAMKMNLARGGLPCSLLFSHGWDEGVYAFAKRVLSAWPDDIEGAYICLLSHPQHFDIDGRLHPSASPYYRVLRADPTPRALILLPSPREPLLSRLWVLSEAFAACRERERGHLEAICVEGTALELLSGEGRAQLEKAEAEEADAALALQTARMEGLEMGATQLLSLDDQVKLEDKERRLDTRLGYAQEKLAKAKLQLLLAPSRDLVDLEGATCSVAQDRTALREQMRGRGDAICLHVAAIVRQSICGVCTRIGQPEETVDGPLGPLPLLERHVRLSVRDLSSGPKALHLARWLWSRPAVTALDLSACVSLAAEVPHLISDALAAGALPHLVSSNLDGAALPIAQLQGSAAAAGASALDFSHQKMSLASGLVIASLISTNTTLDALNVGHNPLRDEGVVAISKALRENGQCRLKTLELQSTRLGVQATKELAATLIATASLTKLDVSHNRICGTWQDTYGAHGRFDAAGLHALSEALPQSPSSSSLPMPTGCATRARPPSPARSPTRGASSRPSASRATVSVSRAASRWPRPWPASTRLTRRTTSLRRAPAAPRRRRR